MTDATRTSKTVLDHLREYEVLGPLSSLSIHPETPGLSTGRVYGDTRKAIELIEWQAAVIAAQQERLDGKAADQRASDDASADEAYLQYRDELRFEPSTRQAFLDGWEAARRAVETVGKQCACDQDCQPEQNEGRECRLSGARIPPDHFSEKTAEFNCTLCQDRGLFFDGIVPGGVPCECKAQKAPPGYMGDINGPGCDPDVP